MDLVLLLHYNVSRNGLPFLQKSQLHTSPDNFSEDLFSLVAAQGFLSFHLEILKHITDFNLPLLPLRPNIHIIVHMHTHTDTHTDTFIHTDTLLCLLFKTMSEIQNSLLIDLDITQLKGYP